MSEIKSNPLKDKSYTFAIQIVRLSQYLVSERREYVLSKQLLRSGTAVGALIREGEFAASKADFVNKFTVSLKEANETEFWLMLLKDTDYLDDDQFNVLDSQCKELISTLVSLIKTTKSRINR